MRTDPTPEVLADAREKILAVIEALGFKPEDLNAESRCSWQVRYRANKGDMTLYANLGWNDQNRLTFGSSLPHHAKASFYGLSAPSITVSRLKTAEQIIKDVKRRLMPDYEAVMVQAREKIASAEAYENAKANNLKAVKGSKLTEEEANSGRWHFYAEGKPYGEVRASNDSVSLELNNLPPAVAAKIIRLAQEA
jgi:hypothetical protein